MADKYLVRTDHGDVMVTVNKASTSGLDPDLLQLARPTGENSGEIGLVVPLKAFAAKMLEIIDALGTGDFDPGPSLRRVMVAEKATAELKRIERWAREHGAA